MTFSIEIASSAVGELKQIEVFYRRQIVNAIEQQLRHDPATPTRNRKQLAVETASFDFEPPIWELRVGNYRVFYDVDEVNTTVYVRAIREKPPHAKTEDIV